MPGWGERQTSSPNVSVVLTASYLRAVGHAHAADELCGAGYRTRIDRMRDLPTSGGLTGLAELYWSLHTDCELLMDVQADLEARLAIPAEDVFQGALDELQCWMDELAFAASELSARDAQELAAKARILLDWCQDRRDIATLLTTSLCKDLIALVDTGP